MQNSYHYSEQQPPPGYTGGYLETPYTAIRPSSSSHEPVPSDHHASRLTSGFMHDFPAPTPGGPGGGPQLTFPYGFDPFVPPPPFGLPPQGHFPNMLLPPQVHTYSSGGPATFHPFNQQFSSGLQTAQYDLDPRKQHGYETGSSYGFPPQGKDLDYGTGTITKAEDEAALQRKQDQQWLKRFLEGRKQISSLPQSGQRTGGVPEFREALYGAARLVSRLTEACETLRINADNERVWTDSYLKTLMLKKELQNVLTGLDNGRLDSWRAKVSLVARRRARLRRARTMHQVENRQIEERISEKEASINKWRTEQIRRVEEKKTEQELKLAADAVLCEVRKKQADVKRMQDILRSLEKLRRLRKEAASRKGIVTERQCEEAFSNRLEQLRSVLRKRTVVYSAEENALMVMLEGEQEEERKREREKRAKKERDKLLQKKQKLEAMLFGDEVPVDSALRPFREYYTQAESSLPALLQIRREWDVFLVASDHPNGSPVPPGWVLPDAPSDRTWASALQTTDTE